MEKKVKKSRKPFLIAGVVVVGAIFMLLAIVYYSVLRPKQPQILVNEISLQSSHRHSGNATSSSQMLRQLTLRMNVTLQNPNKGPFSYVSLGATMYYEAKRLGLVMLPGGTVEAGSRAGLEVIVASALRPGDSFQQALVEAAEDGGVAQIITVTVDLEVRGDVTVLGSFSHHTSVSMACLVTVSPSAQDVVTFICAPHSFGV
ncbi:hypothetical protein KP509_21G088200 [Ceratopteris richardii]|uniref:Late embryogenesis abundant protein LEA-2 subgroup domain-containing protein n=1 Tax=Ceratopteris richardii TaxID=49495 RepID=A0A8T2SF86_CERRI|nr:hypothetical protein KP509_21G088200 [Ceratopteris richardii]